MTNKKTNLSNRAINLLKNDNQTRYKGYVLGERDNEHKSYFMIGKYFAQAMENWGKTGDYGTTSLEEYIELELKDENIEDLETEKEMIVSKITDLINNVKVLELPRPIEAEKEIIFEIDNNYNLKCKLDALYSDYLLDHKTVSSFTKEEDKEEKYGQQARLYQYAYFKTTGNKLPIKFQEIKKGKASIPRELKKEDLQKLLPDNIREKLKTVTEIKDYLRIKPLKERIGNELTFERDDDLVPFCEDLIKKAIVKAEWLKTLDIEDIL